MEQKKSWKAGAPTKYESWMRDKILELMSEGASKLECAVACGVRERTMNDWERDNPEFKEFMDYCVSLAQMWWEREGRLSLRDKDFSHNLYKWQMSVRYGMNEKTESKVSHAMTQEEALKQLDQGVTIEGEAWMPKAGESGND